MLARAVRSVEESDSECPTPVTLRFPKRRYRHPKKGTSTGNDSADAPNSPTPSSSPAVWSSPVPARKTNLTTSQLVDLGLRSSVPVMNQSSEDLKTSLLLRWGKLHGGILENEDEDQLRIESEEAMRRIRQDKDKVLVDLKKSLIKFLKSKRG